MLGTYSPAISTYPNSTEGIGTPSVHTGIADDVYLTLISARDPQSRITLGVRINPMIVWLWIGGGVHGPRHDPGAVAAPEATAAPNRAGRRHRPSPSRTPRTSPLEEVTGVKHPAPLGRARGRGRRRRVRGRARGQRRQRSAESTLAAEPVPRQGRCRTSTSRRSTAARCRTRRRRRQGHDHQLLEHVVHPVPPGGARAQGVLRAARGRHRLRDGRHRARSAGEHQDDQGVRERSRR